MTTKLKLLEWNNYFSYGKDNVLDLTENNVTQILGTNGNGKSSIPLVLEEIAFNKNSKGISKKAIANRELDEGTWGRLTFEKNGDEYVMEVDRRGSLKAKLTKNGDDISSHTATGTYKTLEDILGNDFKTFSQLVYQNTNTSLQFLTATDTNRKKFLIDLFGLDRYMQFFEVFKEEVKTHNSELTSLKAKVSTVEEWLKNNKLNDFTPMEVKEFDIDVFAEEKEAAGLTAELKNINFTNSKISKNNKQKELLSKIDIDKIHAIEIEGPSSYDNEQSELGGIKSTLTRHKSQLSKLEKLGHQCPTCEQTIDESFKASLVNAEKDAIEEQETKAKELEDRILQIKENKKKADYKKEKIQEFETTYNAIDRSLPEEELDKENIEAELANLTIRIKNAKHEAEKIRKHNENANKHNSRLEVIMQQSEEFETQLKELEAKYQELVNNLSHLEVLKKAFSTNGLVAYKIENLVKELEDKTNDYLADLSDGRFTLGFSVTNDKLNVDVTDNGTNISIAELSSGELARVNTSTLLALRQLMNSISKSDVNVLFLDEVISVLDEAGKEKLVEILIEEPNLNTFMIAHSWSHPLLAKLEIVKENGISRIENG